ncbi:amino acid permease [Corynebacterium poyangense]|uniref:Amino acid permease n=1 Tax=Corynebacterium poyangense TaxID=2684405 RepID=A0A7H0SS15_9CORY|nr:amino acid permease [Corynebacterium poyangense]MBZ8177373.1 amino acid permease [Corynebacterium poyangense]QNQ91340.1 amino acid permease [Corynebacterium poyangense]
MNNGNSGPRRAHLSVAQGVALIFGTNIGAGILSLPYAGRNGGFLALTVALIIAGILTTISMLYIAEVSLRTKEPLQLSGLAERYLGHWGRWIIFIAIMVNSIGALIAYATGSGELIANLSAGLIPPLAGTLFFFALGSFIMWKGLEATGVAEGLITSGMAAIILILCFWTFIGPGISLDNLIVFHPYFIVPIMNLAVFTFLAQYVVPEIARGVDPDAPSAVPRSLVLGMVATGFTLALVPFAALGLLGTNVSEVVTLSWGENLGRSAYYLANIFALCAMFTSFIAIGYTAMRNILDVCHWAEHGPRRPWAVALTVLPPLFIALMGWGGFVAALSYAGGFAGAVMSILPVALLHAARRHGNRQPVWVNTWQAHPVIQGVLIFVYLLAFLYSIVSILGLVPAGWA